MRAAHSLPLLVLTLLVAACSVTTSPSDRTPASPPTASRAETTPAPTGKAADPQTAARLKRIMVPLLAAMDHPRSPSQVKIGVVDSGEINAGSAGSGEFLVTRGLLERANDEQLRAVLAHEIAHDDLGHVAKAQALGAGLSIGAAILDQIIPGTSVLTPIAGTLIERKYNRSEEYAADAHGVDILRRAGAPQPKQEMIDTLEWLKQQEGAGGGGFFATHPGTGDRIQALQKLR